MSISTDITRIKTNIANALSAITEKGVTVPDGANSDHLAELISSIEAGSGGTIDETMVKGAFQSFDPDKNLKRVAKLPSEFNYSKATTLGNSGDTLSMSIAAKAGDVIIAAFSHRGTDTRPTINTSGWEELLQTQEILGPNKVGIKIAKYTAEQDGDVEISVTQGVSNERFYGLLINIKDAEVGEIDYISQYGDHTVSSPILSDGHYIIFRAGYFGYNPYYSSTNNVYYERINPDVWSNTYFYSQLEALYFPETKEQNENYLHLINTQTSMMAEQFVVALSIKPKTFSRLVMSNGKDLFGTELIEGVL